MRQTALSCFMWTKKVEVLVRLLFQTTTVYFNDGRMWVTNGGLQRGYCVVPSAKRFLHLYTFLKRKRLGKVIVFFSSCHSAKFHSKLLKCIHVDCFAIHGEQEQQKREFTASEFCSAKMGILLCSAAAACGLDIPVVDWIVQYDPPDEPKEYIDKVGRRARGELPKGNDLLFLIPEELQFLHLFQDTKVPLKKFAYPIQKLRIMRRQLEKAVADNYDLGKSAEVACRSYLSAYSSHSMKDIFNVDHLNLQGVAASFCLFCPPTIIKHGQQQVQDQEEIRLKLEEFSMDS